MLGLIRTIGFSACLATGLFVLSGPGAVTASEPTGGKLTRERLPETGAAATLREATSTPTGKGDRLPVAATDKSCTDQAWPHIAPDCLSPASGGKPRGAVRTITIADASPAGASLSRVQAPAGKTR